MKKTLYIILAGLALIAGLSACEEKPAEPIDTVELRYRANDKYELDAISPQAFTIVVKSTKPWTVQSKHPDWCIISEEEGEAQPEELVHVGKGENTNIKVQYYDNTDLDDRTDQIVIASDGFVGKTVMVYQKGTAFLRVPEDEQALMLDKSGGEVSFSVISNQPWSTKVIEGEWITIADGATGEKNGTVTLSAPDNTGEMRYGAVAVYDRNGEERAIIRLTQDGVLLDPEALEVRAGYDQESSSLLVSSNTKWTAAKGSSADTWFEILNPDGHDGDGTLNLKFQDNSAGSSLRIGSITISSVSANESDPKVQKTIIVKQAYPIAPERHIVDNAEIGLWKSDWDNAPVYTSGVGALFEARCRLNRSSMPFGTYTFHWKDLTLGAGEGLRVRHWFCFSEGCELKADIRPADGKIGYEFNAAGDGNKPTVSSFTDLDFSQPVDITYKFDPSGATYCHVTYLVNGVEAGSFDTSESLLRTVTWGADINMYIGADKTGSAVLEWYEYTKPIDWGE